MNYLSPRDLATKGALEESAPKKVSLYPNLGSPKAAANRTKTGRLSYNRQDAMITAAQLRAARGLLDWTRADLAKAANISPETVKNIEHGTFRPQENTADAIIKAFGVHDVVFTDDEGVKKSNNLVTHYEGANSFRRYVDDLYRNLSNPGCDRLVCIVGIDDKLFSEALGSYVDIHVSRMSDLEGLHFRALANEGVTTFIADKYIEYRRLPNIPLALPFCVYDSYFEIIVFGKGDDYPKVVSVKSKLIAESYKAQFDILWNLSKPVK